MVAKQTEKRVYTAIFSLRMCLLGTVGQRGILQFLGKCPTAVFENKLACTQNPDLGGIPLTREVICTTWCGSLVSQMTLHSDIHP